MIDPTGMVLECDEVIIGYVMFQVPSEVGLLDMNMDMATCQKLLTAISFKWGTELETIGLRIVETGIKRETI